MAYLEMMEVYQKTRKDVFAMAVAYLLDKGFDMMMDIEEDDIVTMEGNGLMTAEFVQDLVRTAKRIADATATCTGYDPIELIQFCMTVPVFSTEFYGGKRVFYEWSTEDIESIADGMDVELDDYEKDLVFDKVEDSVNNIDTLSEIITDEII